MRDVLLEDTQPTYEGDEVVIGKVGRALPQLGNLQAHSIGMA